MLDGLHQLGQEVQQLVTGEAGQPGHSCGSHDRVGEYREKQLEDVDNVRLRPRLDQSVQGGEALGVPAAGR